MLSIKLATFFCVLMVVSAEKYTDKYDNIDLQEILDNRKLLLAYINCVMGRGRCTAEGKEIKDNLEDALQTGCEKCTESQEKGSIRIINHLIKKELEVWKELAHKFDSDGKYRKIYEERARSMGIEIPEV